MKKVINKHDGGTFSRWSQPENMTFQRTFHRGEGDGEMKGGYENKKPCFSYTNNAFPQTLSTFDQHHNIYLGTMDYGRA